VSFLTLPIFIVVIFISLAEKKKNRITRTIGNFESNLLLPPSIHTHEVSQFGRFLK
jgi:hypothetical protein